MTNPYTNQQAPQGAPAYNQPPVDNQANTNPWTGEQAQAPQGAPAYNQPPQAQAPQGYGQQPQAPAYNQAPQAQAPQEQAAPGAQGNAIAGANGTNAPAGNLSDMFARGSSVDGDMLTPKDGSTLGRPVVIRPVKAIDDMPTVKGTTDVVQAEWIWLDEFNPQAPVDIKNGLIFPKVLNNTLRATLSSPSHAFVLGVIGKGEAKNGNSAPWILEDVQDDIVPVAGQAVQAARWA